MNSSSSTAEAYLAGLEPIGWSLGLERMRALCEQLGNPQHRYATVHVVGTNGKTSVCRMVEGLLQAGGLPAGSSVSPHLTLWRERIHVGGEILGVEAFAQASERVKAAATEVEGELGEKLGRLTQFEVATAIAFVALAEAGVEVAAIEAGLGGRLDASNVLESQLTVLTSVGLDHVEWLGETEQEIAAEKLAVLRPGSTLLIGPVQPEVRDLARELVDRQQAELVEVKLGDESAATAAGTTLPGRFRRLDLEIARRAAALVFDRMRPGAERPWSEPDAAAAIVAGLEIPGRLELWPGEVPVVFDVAHNAQGAAALAEALPEVAKGRPIAACLALLADKNVTRYLAALAPALDFVICTELRGEHLRGAARPGAKSLDAAKIAAEFGQYGLEVEAVRDPDDAIQRLRKLAAQQGAMALVTGSHYLVALARDRRLWHH